MKVIYCGFSKCGTTSMANALRELGYTAYDFLEHYQYMKDDWIKICKYGGTREDFRRMFENVDAVTDIPAFFFWEEILDAFPDAKLIFSERNTEDEWFKSFERQITCEDGFIQKLMYRMSPTAWDWDRYLRYICLAVLGDELCEYVLFPLQYSELGLRKAYRKHNTYFKAKAPKDKVLVWKFEDGWGSICEFLNHPVPNKPFPHSNKNVASWENQDEGNPLFRRIEREILFSLFSLSCLSAFGIYKVHYGPGWQWLLNAPNTLISGIKRLYS